MIVWILFIIFSLIVIFIRFNKSFGKSLISLILNIFSCLISFGLARIVVKNMSENVGQGFLKFIGDKYYSDLSELSSLGEFSTFLGSIIVGIVMFYIFYFIVSVIICILKHLLIYYKFDKFTEKSEEKGAMILKKLGIVISTVISVGITFIVLVTPFGFLYNSINHNIIGNDEKKVPFVSTIYLDKLTEMPENENNVYTTNEIDYTLFAISGLEKIDTKEGIEKIRTAVCYKTHFLPSIVAEFGSTAAKHWKNDEEFLSYKIEIPSGREGKLYLSFLDIIENWDKMAVASDVATIANVYQIVDDYGEKKIEEDDGLVYAMSDEEFIEDIFVLLYQNKDFSKLIPIMIEYGLGTTFDYVGLELDENYVSNVDVSKMSEEDIRKEARIISGIIRTVLEVYDRSQALENGKFSEQDIQKIINEVVKLKDSKVLGDIANEIVVQLTSSMSNVQF